MLSTSSPAAAHAAAFLSLLLLTSAHAAPSVDILQPIQRRAAQTYNGCYSSSTGLSNVGTWQYQTSGYCSDQCTAQGNQVVLGLTAGNDCYCGNELPPASAKVDDSKCNTPCFGYGTAMCGGTNFWSVYLIGSVSNVPQAGGSGSSSSAAASTSTPTTTSAGATTPLPATTPSSTSEEPATTTSADSSTTTQAMQTIITSIAPGTTIVVTQPAVHEPTSTPSPSSKSSSGGGSNTAGIAAGVVVGVVAAAAIVGGVFFYLRRRRRQQAEEDYKHSTQTGFMRTNEQKPPGTGYSQASDQRLDPGMGRRNSVGSMADSQDYTRRILRVANPDGN